MILWINSADREKIEVALKKEGEIIGFKFAENDFGSQVLLNLITEILKENNLEFKDLKGIKVEKGPGSYTGLKVGASIANALGFALGIPVNGKKMETDLDYA
ncbi:tRNA (adenosine(37)-N6)-threonylcarbamoyltransferase complex dimerization subunit type 1 TsaB [Candidatus Daviesbacteria bacterium]|nr:tRNA (adenosine(37)-N6)-threonylcarbamoyltransferase complex dimerization subunit type 1 TsaB [Candidatus Daviesbacteria bacterium]